MRKVNILILDDNFIIANKIKKRLFDADGYYRHNSEIQIIPHYLEIDNTNPQISAKDVNNYIIENSIQFLLLDRGFGKIIDGDHSKDVKFEKGIIYKDNNVGGYYIEELIAEIQKIRNNALKKIKGIIVYTYDDYRNINKEGEAIKEEIIFQFNNLLNHKCDIDVLLTFSTIYKVANIELYEGYTGEGIIRIGLKENFILYGLFCGELLYHKLLQIIVEAHIGYFKQKKFSLLFKLSAIFMIFTSISLGANALYGLLFKEGGLLLVLLTFLFAFLVPIIILLLKPSLLIDFEN